VQSSTALTTRVQRTWYGVVNALTSFTNLIPACVGFASVSRVHASHCWCCCRPQFVISVKTRGGKYRRFPQAGVGDMFIATVKKGKPELRKKGTSIVLCCLAGRILSGFAGVGADSYRGCVSVLLFSHTRCRHSATESLATKGWCLHLFRGYVFALAYVFWLISPGASRE